MNLQRKDVRRLFALCVHTFQAGVMPSFLERLSVLGCCRIHHVFVVHLFIFILGLLGAELVQCSCSQGIIFWCALLRQDIYRADR